MLPIIYIGFSSIIIQIIFLRGLLSIFLGNELDIGITLSFWLVFTGIGSIIGRKIFYKNIFPLSFLIIAILLLPSFIVVKLLRFFISAGFGEVISLSKTVLATALILLPLCFVIGMQFPLAVSYVKGRLTVGKIYGLESIGAFVGGIVFTLILSSRVEAIYILFIISIINIIVFSIMVDNRWLLSLIVIPFLFIVTYKYKIEGIQWQNLEVSLKKESKYGEIVVLKYGEQFGIYVNNHLLFSYLDVPSEEMKSHILMTLHKSPKDVLCIGGSLGIVREILKYSVNKVDFVEVDPKIIEISKDIIDKNDYHILKDKRLRIINEDGRRFVLRNQDKRYDVIVLNISAPSNASINRFYTINFFKYVKGIMKEDGIFSIWLQRSSGYIGRSMQVASGSIYNSLKSVFKYVEVTSQEYGGFFSSESVILTEPDLLKLRFNERRIDTLYFHASILDDVFSDFGVEYVRNRLKDIKILNTDFRPATYFYNLLLWAEVQGWNFNSLSKFDLARYLFIIVIIMLFVVLYSYRRIKRTVNYSVITTGFSSMVFVVSLVLIYQSIYGYIYEMIGLLTATFMIGVWAGTNIKNILENSLKMIFLLEFLTVLLSLSVLSILKSEATFYLVMFLVGLIAGAGFNFACTSISNSMSPGKLYAIDLFGSFLGAFLTSVFILPLLGIHNALLTIAVLKLISLFLLYSILSFTVNRKSVSQREEG